MAYNAALAEVEEDQLTNTMSRILVTGALGQIGSELTLALRARYGAQNVVAADIRSEGKEDLVNVGPFERLDVTDMDRIKSVIDQYHVDSIFHMAAILSAVGEEKPQLTWKVNMEGLLNILEIARERHLLRVFSPSSIAVFGPETPPDPAPQALPLHPTKCTASPRSRVSYWASTIYIGSALTSEACAIRVSYRLRHALEGGQPIMR